MIGRLSIAILVVGAACSRAVSLLEVPADQQEPCAFRAANYELTWKFEPGTQSLVFSLAVSAPHDDFWSGVMFGKESPDDAVALIIYHGQLGLVDAQVNGSVLSQDRVSNVQSLGFEVAKGRVLSEFARPIVSSDPADADLSICRRWFFPTPNVIDARRQVFLPSKLYWQTVCDVTTVCADRQPAGLGVFSNGNTDLVRRDLPAEREVVLLQQQQPSSTDAPLKPTKKIDASSWSIGSDAVTAESTASAPRSAELVCELSKGQNRLSWTYNQAEDKVEFVFEGKARDGRHWTGVGVGESMQDMKMVVAFLENGAIKSVGGYSSAGYQQPQKDEQLSQSVAFNAQLSRVQKARTSVYFSAPADMFSPKGCATLNVGFNSGSWGEGFQLKKHTGALTRVEVCGIKRCGAAEEQGDTSGEKEPKTDASQPATTTESVRSLAEQAASLLDDVDPPAPTPKTETTAAAAAADADVDKEATTVAATSAATGSAAASVSEASTAASSSTTKKDDESDEGSGENEPNASSSSSATTKKNPTSGGDVSGEATTQQTPLTTAASQTTPESTTTEKEDADEKDDKDDKESGSTKTAVTEKSSEATTPGKLSTGLSAVPVDEGHLTKIEMNTKIDSTSSPVTPAATTSKPIALSSPPTLVGSSSPNSILGGPLTELGEKSEDEENTSTAGLLPTPSTTSGGPTTASKRPSGTIGKCAEEHVDLMVCKQYFADYLKAVGDWAKRHSQKVEDQMWKACSLLSQVEHVPTMCCTLFTGTCAAHL